MPAAVFVDPEEKMFDATTDNYKTINAPGSYTFTKTFFKLEVEDIADSAFIQVTHNWVPPDSLKTPINELRLSDYRHWRIDAVLPSNFQATGNFQYSRSGDLDSTLILTEEDSIVILYRKDCSEDWQSIFFEQIGNLNIGILKVPDMEPGEYTLAVWDTQVAIPEKKDDSSESLLIFPNPSGGSFTLRHDFNDDAKVLIFNIAGAEVQSFAIEGGNNEITWQPRNLPPGTYSVCIFNSNDELIAKQLVIYAP
jgi:hypothetical protein